MMMMRWLRKRLAQKYFILISVCVLWAVSASADDKPVIVEIDNQTAYRVRIDYDWGTDYHNRSVIHAGADYSYWFNGNRDEKFIEPGEVYGNALDLTSDRLYGEAPGDGAWREIQQLPDRMAGGYFSTYSLFWYSDNHGWRRFARIGIFYRTYASVWREDIGRWDRWATYDDGTGYGFRVNGTVVDHEAPVTIGKDEIRHPWVRDGKIRDRWTLIPR